MADPVVVFFVTTARSGTQWLASELAGSHSDVARVEHEPLGYLYSPCRTLRNPGALRDLMATEKIQAHFADIRNTLAEGRSHVEVGFPAFALVPGLWDLFGSRLRIVHLTRNPLRVAASLTTHRWYIPGARPDVQETVALTPSDSGVVLAHYAERWDGMSAFEKGLFFWYEVHRYGMDLEKIIPVEQFRRFQLERLTGDIEERERLLRFLKLPVRTDRNRDGGKIVDRFHYRTAEVINWKSVSRHPEILELAETLGYPADTLERGDPGGRYQKNILRVFARKARIAALGLIGSI